MAETEFGFLSLLPPLIAIGLAIITRQVILSLFVGIWVGAFILEGFNPFTSFFTVMDHYLLKAVTDTGHASILLFTLTFGGLTMIIFRNGGSHGIVDWCIRKSASVRGTQITTWLLGLVIFFDDYANTLVVGNTMRPIMDRLKISREKLAFIVDATAAPVASLALISTWISTEVSLIAEATEKIGIKENAYSLFLESILYRFYPVLMLFFVGYLAWSNRDLFEMHKVEKASRKKEAKKSEEIKLETGKPYDHVSEQIPKRPLNALLPILIVVISTFVGLWITGQNDSKDLPTELWPRIRAVIGAADAFKAMLWSSLLGTFVALVMTLSQRILSLAQCMETFVDGVKTLMIACIILCLAWSLSSVTSDLKTNEYLISILGDHLMPELVPFFIFIVAAAVSFATGTSWGTMSILTPLSVPLAYTLAQGAGFDPVALHTILVGSIASVLAGSVWGDHCSPISDTTVLSSLASGCDLMAHVRTQLPYALLVAGVGIIFGSLPSAFGFSAWLSLLLGIITLVLVVRVWGRPND